MNGGTGSSVLWLVDGIRVNNRLYGSAYMDTVGIHMIDRIEILYGGEGIFYGTNSTSGVINVITKKPTEELSGEIGVAYGTYNFVDVYGNIGGSIKGHKIMAFFSYDGWTGYIPFLDEEYAKTKNTSPITRSYHRVNAGLKYSKEFNLEGYNNLFLSIQRNFGPLDYPYSDHLMSINDRDEYIAVLKWDHDVTPNYSYYIKAYFHYWWTDFTKQELDLSYENYQDLWGFEDWGINILNSYRTDSEHEILVGFDYQNYWGKDYVVTIRPVHEQVYALFAQYRPHFDFWEDWKVALGLRYNYSTGNDSIVWNASTFVPIMPDGRLYLKASVGTSFILPTAAELYADMPNRHGNINLRPQLGFTINTAIGTRQKLFDFEVAGFYEDMTDRISRDIQNVYQNLEGQTLVKGFTVSTTIKPIEGLVFTGSYTGQWFEQKVGGIKSTYLAGFPRNYAKLGVQYDGKYDEFLYGLGLFSSFLGKTYMTLENQYVKYGDYWITDFKFYFKPSDKITFNVSLENLFDTQYGYSMASIPDASQVSGFHFVPSPLGMPFTVVVSATYKF
jgi:vitamin B12 transporter